MPQGINARAEQTRCIAGKGWVAVRTRKGSWRVCDGSRQRHNRLFGGVCSLPNNAARGLDDK